jgi:hypothetical protein
LNEALAVALERRTLGTRSKIERRPAHRRRWRTNGEYATIPAVPRSVCSVSFKDERGIRHTVEVEAESLFEAAILAVRAFRKAEWITNVGPAMPLDIEVRAPVTRHTITLIQVQRWLDGSVNSPNEMVKKAKLKELLTKP